MSLISYISATEAVKNIKSGNRVFLHGSAATPIHIIQSLLDRYQELKDVEFVSISNFGDINFSDERYRKSFFINSLFVSAKTIFQYF